MIPGLSGRKVVIATMHEKEKVLAPVLEQLGLFPIVAAGFDTDQLGTFSGEIERKHSALETAIEKARLACKQFDCSLALASEGSFGPHPFIPFVSADTEILVLWDNERQIEFHHAKTGTSTNFSMLESNDLSEVVKFACVSGLPDHGFIVKSGNSFIKGLRTEEQIAEAFCKLQGGDSSKIISVETDMRAMYNPTRMSFIRETALEFAEKLKRLCPACQQPDFSICNSEQGVPCSWCGAPTRGVEWMFRICRFCGYREKERPVDYSPQADPMICDYCNP